MKYTQKHLLGLAGIIGVVSGILLAVPSFGNERYWLGAFGTLLTIIGLILLAISFGD